MGQEQDVMMRSSAASLTAAAAATLPTLEIKSKTIHSNYTSIQDVKRGKASSTPARVRLHVDAPLSRVQVEGLQGACLKQGQGRARPGQQHSRHSTAGRALLRARVEGLQRAHLRSPTARGGGQEHSRHSIAGTAAELSEHPALPHPPHLAQILNSTDSPLHHLPRNSVPFLSKTDLN